MSFTCLEFLYLYFVVIDNIRFVACSRIYVATCFVTVACHHCTCPSHRIQEYITVETLVV